ncbi:hypothetical protein MMPV_004424 [Pyropia vietnamensis]
MALLVLVGRVIAVGSEVTFVDEAANPARKSADVGWDPIANGGVRPELILFLRGFFRVGRAARTLALAIQSCAVDLLRRVPQRLKDLVAAVVADLSEDGLPTDVFGIGAAVADDDDGKTGDDWASDGEPEGDPGVDMEDVTDEDEVEPPYAEQLREPALADTGGAGGASRASKCVMPLMPTCPSTAASSVCVLSFLRAVVVEPVTVWAPRGNWTATTSLVTALQDEGFSIRTLAAALNHPDVAELRLLRSAVACLGPAVAANRHLRGLLARLLGCLPATMRMYDAFVADKFNESMAGDATNRGDQGACGTSGRMEEEVVDDGDDEFVSQEEMANAHPHQVFTASQYSRAWLRSACDDILKTGIWAPGLPVVRALPDFVGVAAADTDQADCNHRMGQEVLFTGGSFGAFCTCQHPKCVGVKVLDGSEGQRMPIEFVVQRFVTFPDAIVYDFACATLKTALVRLPDVAKDVKMLVDRFHWGKSHTDCSLAMCPDAYKSMDGVNTSSSEERNALSRRQQHHLRLMKQDQFIYFTVYQQALSNVIAMYRDQSTKYTTMKWPEWYRRTHVDT